MAVEFRSRSILEQFMSLFGFVVFPKMPIKCVYKKKGHKCVNWSISKSFSTLSGPAAEISTVPKLVSKHRLWNRICPNRRHSQSSNYVTLLLHLLDFISVQLCAPLEGKFPRVNALNLGIILYRFPSK